MCYHKPSDVLVPAEDLGMHIRTQADVCAKIAMDDITTSAKRSDTLPALALA